LGRVAATHTRFPNFGKVEYFYRRGLTDGLGVLPDGPRKGLWFSLVIPGRDEGASPESIFAACDVGRWIPGSMLRIAPE
jgi:hypothetical protein